MMKKTIAAGTIALTLAGAGFALAQQSTRTREERGLRPSAEDLSPHSPMLASPASRPG